MGGTYGEVCTKKSIYMELSYTDFCRRRQANQSYMNKMFIPVQGCLLEVMREPYANFYKDKEQWRYLKKLDTDHSLLYSIPAESTRKFVTVQEGTVHKAIKPGDRALYAHNGKVDREKRRLV